MQDGFDILLAGTAVDLILLSSTLINSDTSGVLAAREGDKHLVTIPVIILFDNESPSIHFSNTSSAQKPVGRKFLLDVAKAASGLTSFYHKFY